MFENPRCLGCFGLYVLQRGSGTYAVRHSEKSSDMFALLLRPDEHVSGHGSVLCDKKAGMDDALQIDKYGQYTRYT